MIPKEIKYNLHYNDVRGDFLRPPDGTTPAIIRAITKTCLYNFDPLKPHFYTVKLGLTGAYIIFPISAQKHRLWVLVRTASARRF